MKKQHILVIDDDPAIVKFLSANLKAEGFKVSRAMNGGDALDIFEAELPDIVILDIKLPDSNGATICQKLREWTQIPIIMLSGYGDNQTIINCLNIGADDFVCKPFSIGELVARINAIVRRFHDDKPAPEGFQEGDLQIDFASQSVKVAGKEVHLTRMEFSVLQELVKNQGKVLTHAQLIARLYGADYKGDVNCLRTFVSRLRRKLQPDHHIESLLGVGYKFGTLASV